MKPNGHKHHVTIKQVAELAGVSQMTVSRVINDHRLVKAATREKVQNAIAKLNYRPNLSARRLAGGKALFIGLVYHNPSPGYLNKVLVGGLSACREAGHHLVLEDLGQRAPYSEPVKTAEYLSQAGLDGVIVTPPISNLEAFMDTLDELNVPVVRIAAFDLAIDKPHISMDDHLAVREIVGHIIDHGHRNIAFIKGPSTHPAGQHRYSGFAEEMKARGLDVKPEYVLQGDFTYRSGMDCGEKLLSLPTPPTAVYASNDDMAAGVVTAAYRKGLAVPHDLSVAGFDDTEIATNIWPPLTTIRQPISEMAAQAIRLLAAHIHGNTDDIHELSHLMEFELVKRDTVARPQ